eukprot:Gb_02598 [translate_table: standard]
MEMWLILAAAGSGYLAKYWQNTQKNKESISDQADSVPDRSTNYARGSDRRFSAADKGYVRKNSGTGKWPGCRQPRRTRNIAESSKPKNDESPIKQGGSSENDADNPFECPVNIGSADREINFNSQNCNIDSEPRAEKGTENLEGTNISPKGVDGGSCSFGLKTDRCYYLDNLGEIIPEVNNENTKLEDTNRIQFGSRGGKRTKEEIYQEAHVIGDQENANIFGYNYLDETGFGQMLQTDKSHRNVEISGRFGKRRDTFYRRRALRTYAKPMSSLESCLVAQLSGENDKHDGVVSSSFLSSPVANQRPLIITDGSRIISKSEISPLLLQFPSVNYGMRFESVKQPKEYETVIGLPPLPTRGLKKSQSRRKERLGKIRVSKLNKLNSQNSRNAGVMAADSGLLKRRKMSQSDASALTPDVVSGKHFQLQDTSSGFVLFSFGVGIGIMSTIISSRREVEKLNELLRQTQELVQDLEDELEMRDSLTVKDLTAEEHLCVETWQDPNGEGHGQRDASSDGLLEEGCEIGEKTSIVDSGERLERMTRVEAELEAELERLELNLNTSKHQRKFSGLSEIDPDCIADVVHGELREDDLTRNVESEEDNSASTQEEVYTENYAVSPRDLARRLHEVLETRLQDRIIELEAELESCQSKLQAIGIQHQQSKELNQNPQYSNPGPEVPASRAAYTEKQNDLSVGNSFLLQASVDVPLYQKEIGPCFSKELSEGSPIGDELTIDCYSQSQLVNFNKAGSEDLNAQNNDDEESKGNLNLPLFLTLSGDALTAYNEAYNDFTKVMTEKGASVFDSAEVKDAPLSKHSVQFKNQATKHLSWGDSLESNGPHISHCCEECDLPKKDGKGVSHPEPVPLLSTSWNMEGCRPHCSQARFNSRQIHSCSSPKQMELEFEGMGLKGTDFRDYVVEDTSGSTPCSLKFVDTTDLVDSFSDRHNSLSMDVAPGSSELMISTCTLSRTDGFLSHTGASRLETAQFEMAPMHQTQARQRKNPFSAGGDLPEVSTLVLDKIRSWNSLAIEGTSEFDADESLLHQVGHFKMPDSKPPFFHDLNNASDASDYASEVDEEVGKLLIKRIIEKTRQGSPIIREAENMLASLEKNDFEAFADLDYTGHVNTKHLND